MVGIGLPKYPLLVLFSPSEQENDISLDSVYSNFQPSLSHINPEGKVRMTRMSHPSCTLSPALLLRQAKPLCVGPVSGLWNTDQWWYSRGQELGRRNSWRQTLFLSGL